MTPDELLHELESLTHDTRIKRMVEIGRNATIDASAAATLNALEQGEFYERRLALQSCNGSRDPGRVLRALGDPSRAIRTLAVALLPLLGDDAQVQSALTAMPFKQRRVLLRGLYKRRRYTIIDAFLDALAASGDEQFSRLLPFGSSAVVTCHLEPVVHQLGQSDWRRLTRLHPNIAANVLQSQAEAMTNLNQRLVWQANLVLPLLAKFCPERALSLVRTLSRHVPLAWLELQQLTWRRPAEVADLILHSNDKARVSFDRVAHKLDINVLLALLEHKGSTLSGLNVWLQKLTPAQRMVIYTACAGGWRDREGCIPHWLVALLPPALREQEGRYHLALPTLATRSTERLSYTAFLQWDEARIILTPFIHNPDAKLRVAALTALVFATRFQRQCLPELLLIVCERRNEQDPVRCAMLNGLADLPPGIWLSQHLDSLGQIIRDALDAADQSHATVAAAERLIIALLPSYPAWAADWLATLVQERGQISFYHLSDRLSVADVRRIAPVLLPVLQSWETREREMYLVAAAQSLGRRLRVFAGLVDILERVLKETRNSWIASSALGLIAKHRRERMTSLIPELLSDPSWGTQHVVYGYLHRHRQDLLTPFLGQQAYSGRFSTGKTRFVLPLFSGFYRWTSQQQALFAATLSSVAGDSVRDSPAIITSIAQLAALPAVLPTQLVELASDPRQAVRDTALRALGRLDAGQGVPTLLAAMADDRARIAIYALRRSLLEMPVTQALPLLRSVPLEKVTVAKEVVRLLGELSSESAYQELLALDNRELHRDVRVALLRALWSHPERAQTWAVLERAAVSPDAALAAIVARTPVDQLSSDAQRRLVALLATLLVHPDPTVRLDVLRRCGHLPVADPQQLLLPRLLEAMGSFLPDESSAAASAVFATYSGENAHLVGLAVQRLIANRRALQTAIRALKAALTISRGQLLSTVHTVLEALATDPLTVSLRVEIAIYALPWNELTALLTQLIASDEMHADALALAAQAIEHSTDATNLANLEAALANNSDERLRRLALAALVAQSQSRGWDSQRLERLHSYRTDSSPMVAAAAQFTLPPVEHL